jgi:hypothetical protein
VEVAVWRCANVYVLTGGVVDMCFHLLLFVPMAGWRRQWFFLKNDIDEPLSAVTGRCLLTFRMQLDKRKEMSM